jgi:hypothetical protein
LHTISGKRQGNINIISPSSLFLPDIDYEYMASDEVISLLYASVYRPELSKIIKLDVLATSVPINSRWEEERKEKHVSS